MFETMATAKKGTAATGATRKTTKATGVVEEKKYYDSEEVKAAYMQGMLDGSESAILERTDRMEARQERDNKRYNRHTKIIIACIIIMLLVILAETTIKIFGLNDSSND